MTRDRLITTPVPRGQVADTSAGNFNNQIAKIAFDTSAILADKANKKFEMDFRNQAQEGINEAFERNKNDPSQLKKEFTSLRSGLVRSTPRNLRDNFDNSFSQLSRPFLNKATNNYNNILTADLKSSSLQNLDHARVAASRFSSDLFSKDPLVVSDATEALNAKTLELVDTLSQTDATGKPVFSGTERFRLLKKFTDETSFSAVRDAYDGAEDKEQFLQGFNNGDLKASIFVDDKGGFRQGSIKDEMDRKTFERTRNWMERDIGSRRKEREEAALLSGQLNAMESVKSGEWVLDANNKEQKKMVDADWKVLQAQNQGLSPDEKAQFSVDYISEVGVVPTQLESSIRGFLTNGTIEQRSMAADTIEKIADSRPSTLAQFSERDRVTARQITENLNAGLDPEQAVAFADSNVFQRDTPEYKTRVSRFKDEDIKFSEGNFTEFFRDDPAKIPAGMEADFNTLTRKYYLDGGLSAKGSEKTAIETVKNNWTITNIGSSPRWMKYAPEVKYDNGQDPVWIKEQLVADVLESGVVAEDVDKFTDSLLIEVVPETVNDLAPSYLVFTQDDQGLIEPLRNVSGFQQTFKPQWESSPRFKKLMKKYNNDVTAAMIDAKRLRNQKIEAEAIEANIISVKEGF